ncbi:hypothetical protein [Nitrosomonas sp.]|uniref:hypothetical protein n=1 Tax=Nitrosomonas sp. TaxID=42353 RepID=UPI001D683399|nr:hypothetical protein [Nitrosomonas sp.]MBX3616830.1 hypothetical protein [Nitrosomonas sp.]
MPGKGKKSNKPAVKELPDRYPRTEEILIFSDISDLDHVFGLLDQLNENANSAPPNISSNEWEDIFKYSTMCYLIGQLKKACFEYERFWIDEEDWNLEEDEEFNEYMNDPEELWWLVNELDHGRWGLVNGKNTRFYDPAYHAAARSLQMAMYTYKYVGDHEWVSYCINELKQTLTRYHAASLEIVMHRDNIYLSSKQKYFPSIDRMNAGNKKRICEQQEEAAANYAEIKREFSELSKIKPHKNKTNLVKELVSKGYGERTIWRALKDNPDS